jgi:AcrR family transcriptional regulator
MEKQNEINLLTKECILTALLRLMEEKPYSSISITDITTLAGVSRMAYYRNYS